MEVTERPAEGTHWKEVLRYRLTTPQSEDDMKFWRLASFRAVAVWGGGGGALIEVGTNRASVRKRPVKYR